MPDSYDIAISGGGMVGAALACALGQAGLRVALVEAAPPANGAWPEFDPRVSAVTRASQRIFQSLGAWQAMAARRITPYREMRVWDAASRGSIHFDSADIGEPDLGYIIENRVIQAGLEERLAELATVRWYRPAVIETLRVADGGIDLDLGGARIRAQLAVGADGAHSRLRGLAGIDVTDEAYGHDALVTTVKTGAGHGDTAWQRFLPDGPLAFLPLPDPYCSIVWSASPARVKTLLGLAKAEFLSELEAASEGRLGSMDWCGERAAFPLRRRHAACYVRDRVSLVGDAAHTIHPLAGQGVNLGLLDAASLAQVLVEARERGRDIGAFSVLRRYERWRKGHNLVVQAAMGGLKHLFASPLAPVRMVRGLGLGLTDTLPPLKDFLIRQAMGLEGDLPEMAKEGVWGQGPGIGGKTGK